jgi:hypothetical protein
MSARPEMPEVPDVPPIGACTKCGMQSVLDADDYCAACAKESRGYDEGSEDTGEAIIRAAMEAALENGLPGRALIRLVDDLVPEPDEDDEPGHDETDDRRTTRRYDTPDDLDCGMLLEMVALSDRWAPRLRRDSDWRGLLVDVGASAKRLLARAPVLAAPTTDPASAQTADSRGPWCGGAVSCAR